MNWKVFTGRVMDTPITIGAVTSGLAVRSRLHLSAGDISTIVIIIRDSAKIHS